MGSAQPAPGTLEIYNGMIRRGESVRAFPLSNWTEVDIWRYIQAENIELPPLYYAKKQKYVERDGMLMWAEDRASRPCPANRSRKACCASAPWAAGR